MTFVPRLGRSMQGSQVRALTLEHPLLDGYLAFVGARARLNTWLATAYDLTVFFTVMAKEPALVTALGCVHVPQGAAGAAARGAGGAARGRRGRLGRAHDRPAAVCLRVVRLLGRPRRCRGTAQTGPAWPDLVTQLVCQPRIARTWGRVPIAYCLYVWIKIKRGGGSTGDARNVLQARGRSQLMSMR